MIKSFLGIKIDQSQMFTPVGDRIPVTRILANPCTVVEVKDDKKHGYEAVQLGVGSRRVKTVSKAIIGHLKKAGTDQKPPRFLREVRLGDLSNLGDLKPGIEIKIGDVFIAGDIVQVTGVSKGKGFAGVVKRHHFKGGPRTHGQSDRERAPGSIGQTTTPGRVYKGKRMAGRMGGDRVTVKNLKVVNIDSEKNILTISGVIPGGRDALVVIEKLNA